MITSNRMDMDSATIQAIATLVLVAITGYYAFTNHKLMQINIRGLEKPRKEDELENLIYPIKHQCKRETGDINKSRFWIFDRLDSLYKDILENDIKKMLYEDFISNRISLNKMMDRHEQLFHQMKNVCGTISKKFNEDKYQSRIKDMLIEFNKDAKTRISETSLSSFSDILLFDIMEDIDIENNSLGEPDKTFWKKFGKELLFLRDKDFKPQLEELNILGKQLIQINDNITSYLNKICNEYTKKYGISLKEELKFSYFY